MATKKYSEDYIVIEQDYIYSSNKGYKEHFKPFKKMDCLSKKELLDFTPFLRTRISPVLKNSAIEIIENGKKYQILLDGKPRLEQVQERINRKIGALKKTIDDSFKDYSDDLTDKLNLTARVIITSILELPVILLRDKTISDNKGEGIGTEYLRLKNLNSRWSHNKMGEWRATCFRDEKGNVKYDKTDQLTIKIKEIVYSEPEKAKGILHKWFIIWDTFIGELESLEFYRYTKSPLFIDFFNNHVTEFKGFYKQLHKGFPFEKIKSVGKKIKSISSKEINLDQKEELDIIDYSDTANIQKFVMLHETGILKYLEDKLPHDFSEAKLGSLISSFTGINADTAKRYINSIKNKDKNNPLKNKNINPVSAKLTRLGLTDTFKSNK